MVILTGWSLADSAVLTLSVGRCVVGAFCAGRRCAAADDDEKKQFWRESAICTLHFFRWFLPGLISAGMVATVRLNYEFKRIAVIARVWRWWCSRCVPFWVQFGNGSGQKCKCRRTGRSGAGRLRSIRRSGGRRGEYPVSAARWAYSGGGLLWWYGVVWR